MFRDFIKPPKVYEPRPVLTWHRCSHPQGMTKCKGDGCDKGEVCK